MRLWCCLCISCFTIQRGAGGERKSSAPSEPSPGVLLPVPGTALGWPGSSLGKGALWLLCAAGTFLWFPVCVSAVVRELLGFCNVLEPILIAVLALTPGLLGTLIHPLVDNAWEMQSNTCDTKSWDELEEEHLSVQDHPSFRVYFDKGAETAFLITAMMHWVHPLSSRQEANVKES